MLVHEDRTCPIVAVNVWYHVGSKNEQPGRTGLAHLFEHLMFEGSAHHDRGYFQPLQAAGAVLNGSTNTDRTNYWEVVPTGALELALWLESDRMGYLLPALTDAKFTNQRDVVLNERRQNYENRPYGLAAMATVAALYPSEHPYHWLTIGSADDLRATTLDEVRAFFAQHYHPANASLAIAGAVSADEAFTLAERYFGEIATGPARTHVNGYAALPAEKRLQLEDRVELPRLYLAWHSPAMFAPGDADLDLVADLLASGKTSRLYRRLVYEMRLATEVAAFQQSREASSFFQVIATAAPGHTLEEVERAAIRGDCPLCARRADTVRTGSRDRAGRGAVRLPAADRRRFWRKERSAQRLQRVSGRARILRARPGTLSRRDARVTRRRRVPLPGSGAARRGQRRSARSGPPGARGFVAGRRSLT